MDLDDEELEATRELHNQKNEMNMEGGLVVQDLNEIPMSNNPNIIASNFYTNIKDKKLLFNLEGTVDFLLNDCENKELVITGVVIKTYYKKLKNPVYDDETGELLRETETTMSVVLVDKEGKTYATGSKIFGLSLMRYLRIFGNSEIDKGLKIKIIKKKMNEGKALDFELI